MAAKEEHVDKAIARIARAPTAEELERKRLAQDETLQCRDCGGDFIFTVGEQEFFKSKGFENKNPGSTPLGLDVREAAGVSEVVMDAEETSAAAPAEAARVAPVSRRSSNATGILSSEHLSSQSQGTSEAAFAITA
jgi:hypothetical protein